MNLSPGAGPKPHQAPSVKCVLCLLSYISHVILCCTAAEISSQSGECLRQRGLQLSECSSPPRDMDVCLN